MPIPSIFPQLIYGPITQQSLTPEQLHEQIKTNQATLNQIHKDTPAIVQANKDWEELKWKLLIAGGAGLLGFLVLKKVVS